VKQIGVAVDLQLKINYAEFDNFKMDKKTTKTYLLIGAGKLVK